MSAVRPAEEGKPPVVVRAELPFVDLIQARGHGDILFSRPIARSVTATPLRPPARPLGIKPT